MKVLAVVLGFLLGTGEVSGAYLLLLVLQRGTGTVIMGLVCRVVETWAGVLTNSLYSSLTEIEE